MPTTIRHCIYPALVALAFATGIPTHATEARGRLVLIQEPEAQRLDVRMGAVSTSNEKLAMVLALSGVLLWAAWRNSTRVRTSVRSRAG